MGQNLHVDLVQSSNYCYPYSVLIATSTVLTKMYSDSNVVVNIIIASSYDTALVSTKLIGCYWIFSVSTQQ